MLDNILKETEDRMQKALESTKDKFSHVRAGSNDTSKSGRNYFSS